MYLSVCLYNKMCNERERERGRKFFETSFLFLKGTQWIPLHHQQQVFVSMQRLFQNNVTSSIQESTLHLAGLIPHPPLPPLSHSISLRILFLVLHLPLDSRVFHFLGNTCLEFPRNRTPKRRCRSHPWNYYHCPHQPPHTLLRSSVRKKQGWGRRTQYKVFSKGILSLLHWWNAQRMIVKKQVETCGMELRCQGVWVIVLGSLAFMVLARELVLFLSL